MTIAVVWQEDGFLWCAADTRLVAGEEDTPKSEIAAKMYAIPLRISAFGEDGFIREPHYWTQYGFVYAGAAAPAAMTAVTASTFLQYLARPGDRANPPRFEECASFIQRLSSRFMRERRQFGDDGLFSASFFGWCPYDDTYKVGHLVGRDDAGSFRVDLHYPPAPEQDGDPWVVLGSGQSVFHSILSAYDPDGISSEKRRPLRVVNKMVRDEADPTVGGSTSVGIANQHGFELVYSMSDHAPSPPRLFNGLDLDRDVGAVGDYIVSLKGII